MPILDTITTSLVTPSGSLVISQPSVEVPCTNVNNEWWLIDCETMAASGIATLTGVPGAAIPLNVINTSLSNTISEIQAQHDILGSDYVTIIADTILGADISFEVDFLNLASYNAFVALRALQKTLLLQAPYGAQWYMRFDSDVTPVVNNAADVYQTVSFNLIEQARP